METSFQIHIPEKWLQLGIDRNELQRRVKEWLIISLFTEGNISSGKAANLLNMGRVDFLSFLRTRGISYVNYTPDELAEEFSAVEDLNSGKNT